MDCVLFYYIQNLIDNSHLFFHCQQLDKMNMINTIGIFKDYSLETLEVTVSLLKYIHSFIGF